MAIASIELSEHELRALQRLAQQTGKTQEELVHEAITYLLEQVQSERRLQALQQARGLWKDRGELPDIRVMRSEFDRQVH